MANHNRLLGRVKGVDGIKTGYTRASGFNLVSSVTDGDRRIVAVVMGGKTARRATTHGGPDPKYMPKASSTRQRRSGRQGDSAGDSPSARSQAVLPKEKAPSRKPGQEEECDGGGCEARPRRSVEPTKRHRGRRSESRSSKPRSSWSSRPTPSLSPRHGRPRSGQDRLGRRQPAGRSRSLPRRASPRRRLSGRRRKTGAAVLASASSYTVTFNKGGVTYHRARFGGFGSKDGCNEDLQRR